MVLDVWTDGSFRDKSICSVFILTEDQFVERLIEVKKIRTSFESELYCVVMAARKLKEMDLSMYSNVVIYCDALSVTRKYRSIQDGAEIGHMKLNGLWSELMGIVDSLPIPVQMVRYVSHLKEHNPNKTCDFIGRILGKNQECITAT